MQVWSNLGNLAKAQKVKVIFLVCMRKLKDCLFFLKPKIEVLNLFGNGERLLFFLKPKIEV